MPGASAGTPCPAGSCASSRRRTSARRSAAAFAASLRRLDVDEPGRRPGSARRSGTPAGRRRRSAFQPRPAAARTSGMASWPAPQTSSRSGGSSTSTNARTPPAKRPDLRALGREQLARRRRRPRRRRADPRASRPARRRRAARRSGRPARRRRRSDSSTVTTLIGRSSSSAIRSAPATSAARSAGSMKTSIAPLQPSPSPHTASSSAVRSQPARRARALVHHDPGHVGDVALQAAAADVADRRALLGDQQPGAGAAVGRAADGDDRGQRHPLALGGQRLDRGQDVGDLAHALDGIPARRERGVPSGRGIRSGVHAPIPAAGMDDTFSYRAAPLPLRRRIDPRSVKLVVVAFVRGVLLRAVHQVGDRQRAAQ